MMSEHSRWPRRSRSTRDTDVPAGPTPKPPIILGLARPNVSYHSEDTGSAQPFAGDSAMGATSDGQHGAAGGGQHRAGGEKPIVVLRSRDENRNSSVSPGPTASSVTGESTVPHPTLSATAPYPPQTTRHTSASQPMVDPGKNRLGAPPEMKHSVKIIDDNFRWIDEGIDDLADQTDYLVVGALGLQGSGKSTILSMLAGNTAQDPYRNYIFQPQVKETREDAVHQTVGVDMFVSPERIILLDTQPALSPSILDYLIRQERKLPQEFTSAENFVEMQSLQIASFLMTVCHVILVSQDWFTDLTFLRSLLTAEMLRPQTHTGSHDGSQSSNNQDDSPEFYPTVVFVLNRAGQDDFTPETYADMKVTLKSIFQSSKLRYQGAVNMHNDGVIAALKMKERPDANVNLFLLPTMEYYKTEPESILSSLPEYRGFPSFAFLMRSLRNQVYSVPRIAMTPTPLTEKNWFHFAARTWEAVKKSQLFAEYNRLLP